MVYNKRDLKVISIIQIVMTVIFFAIGMVDRFEVRYMQSSFLFAPCWIAALVLPVGVIGLVLSQMSRRSLTLIYTLKSVSIACVAVSAATMYHYQWGIGVLLVIKYITAQRYHSSYNHLADKDMKFKFTDQENTMLAISSLAIVFSIIEIILAFASAKSCSGLAHEPPQENQAGNVYNQFGAGQIELQPTYIAAQPMVAVPVSNYNVNQ
ncbi:uncharacterized protein LOC144666438 [Oculina patagonica]